MRVIVFGILLFVCVGFNCAQTVILIEPTIQAGAVLNNGCAYCDKLPAKSVQGSKYGYYLGGTINLRVQLKKGILVGVQLGTMYSKVMNFREIYYSIPPYSYENHLKELIWIPLSFTSGYAWQFKSYSVGVTGGVSVFIPVALRASFELYTDKKLTRTISENYNRLDPIKGDFYRTLACFQFNLEQSILLRSGPKISHSLRLILSTNLPFVWPKPSDIPKGPLSHTLFGVGCTYALGIRVN
jgi:hypothetical protein